MSRSRHFRSSWGAYVFVVLFVALMVSVFFDARSKLDAEEGARQKTEQGIIIRKVNGE